RHRVVGPCAARSTSPRSRCSTPTPSHASSARARSMCRSRARGGCSRLRTASGSIRLPRLVRPRGGSAAAGQRRARRELGWEPRWSAEDALLELLGGLREGAGFGTPPLAPQAGGPLRVRELLTGVGGRERA